MKKGLVLTQEQAEAHQRKHGFLKGGDALCQPRMTLVGSNGAPTSNPKGAPKPRQNKTEAEYGLILEAMKRRGEILDYRPFGIKLEWGADPETGKPMVYSGDYTVFVHPYTGGGGHILPIKIIEVKGGYVHPKDWIRFKGCRACWPMFLFELHQKADGEWRRLL